MNCDQVFDVLTRGPFPTGSPSDPAVELHLLTCFECRALAEALRPALDLFEEAIEPEESRELPGYWGQLLTLSAEPKIVCDEPLPALPQPIERAAPPLHTYWSSVQLWRCVAAVLLGVIVGAAFRSQDGPSLSWPRSDKNASKVVPAEVRESLPSRRFAAQTLLALGLPADCFDRPLALSIVDATNGEIALALSNPPDFRCCTDCHSNMAAQRLSRESGDKLRASCQACHAKPAS